MTWLKWLGVAAATVGLAGLAVLIVVGFVYAISLI